MDEPTGASSTSNTSSTSSTGSAGLFVDVYVTTPVSLIAFDLALADGAGNALPIGAIAGGNAVRRHSLLARACGCRVLGRSYTGSDGTLTGVSEGKAEDLDTYGRHQPKNHS